ncbi:protein FAR1-RELATED SEQUENCE 5-like [Papaver somniferum]|uniref:protein FAR1-RELATED SEQUENCE 5-like n=1 Tax=Papaver somniferum TaxID=3469 RepID=UPI000E703441|nr:protein FAR1-RELATED SEQUENCE 5-like [Papaver somniferum]
MGLRMIAGASAETTVGDAMVMKLQNLGIDVFKHGGVQMVDGPVVMLQNVLRMVDPIESDGETALWDLNFMPTDDFDQDDFHYNDNGLLESESSMDSSDEVDENSVPDGDYTIRDPSDDVPKLGMTFESDDKLFEFYNEYARRKGFSVRKGHVKRSSDGQIRKRVVLCSKEGFKERHKRGTPQKERPILRTGCMARIQCIAQGGSLVVTKFDDEHNHELADVSEAHLLLPQQATYMESLHSGGCGPTQTFAIMSADHHGSDQLNFTQIDCKNYFQKRRREIYKKGDAQVAVNYFRHMQKENPAFFYAVQVDKNDQACNFFWADAKCAPFVGVNHHGMSVLFGMALLLDETIESFVWVFDSFLSAISGKHPKTIFTYQAQAIGNAIKQAMPTTHHRLCL